MEKVKNKITIQGKQACPSGKYKSSITLTKITNGDESSLKIFSCNIFKFVLVEPLDSETYRAWTALKKIGLLPDWKESEKEGFYCKDMHKSEFKIFNFLGEN
jgi:hypothetical protein